MPPKRYKYWMVHGDQGNRPVVVHDKEESAIEEAKRLARANPGKSFAVLESQYEYTLADAPVEKVPHEHAPQLHIEQHDKSR